VTVDPQAAAIVAALALGAVTGLPGLHASLRRRRRAVRECLRCGRTLLLGERTCDCGPVE
jgi:hypothetical protein